MKRLDYIVYTGNCHCNAIKFEIYAPIHLSIVECNCTICYVTGFLHLHVENKDFTLICGKSQLSTYSFNTMIAQHTFCKICGVKSFYKPRSHPKDYSINFRCLNIPITSTVGKSFFDGKHWEDNIEKFSSTT